MRSIILIYLLLIINFASAQTNKPAEGDIGIRYGVAFNGTFAQTIALSGILKNGFEFGTGIRVLYVSTKSESISTNTAIGANSVTITNQISTSSQRYVSVSLLPYAVYHFPVKGNLDVYAGLNMLIGAGPVYLYNNRTFEFSGRNFTQVSITYKSPPAYQVGGGITLGCQYFFYKQLALGVEANFGAGYTAQKGPLTITEVANNISATTKENLDTHSLTIQSASSAGVYLTFYFERKKNKGLGAYDKITRRHRE
ncbi:MAG: hypothetical protein JWO06_1385 [Bacteroidota bacterium]|nr:hypothetical protein [Bacteroidota bacterium]